MERTFTIADKTVPYTIRFFLPLKYSILTNEDKLEVSSVFDLTVEDLEDFLPLLSNYRNLCAHEDIVFDHKTERCINDTIYHKKLNIFKMDDEYIYGKNDLFALVIILKCLD